MALCYVAKFRGNGYPVNHRYHTIITLRSVGQVECELTFVGLLVLQNTLKPETSPVIRQLMSAKIRTVMVTGLSYLYPSSYGYWSVFILATQLWL